MTLIAPASAREADAQLALATAFAPKSLAIAGVSPRTTGWGGGQMFLRGIRQLNRVPDVYCLNPRGGELDDGTPLYPSLRDVPGPVESLISAVPASAILGLVDDAVAKGVKVIHLFTAGFGETGSAERASLEQEVLTKLRAANIRLIGPNCMGVHSTRGGVSWMAEASATPGRVGMLSQSGMNASEVSSDGARRGIEFSNIASFGNASDLNEADFLQFLAHDPDTDIILAYLEGIRDGRRFLRIARDLSRPGPTRKPLVVLKGGLTEAGSRAAASHTGSLAGSEQIWNAVQRQGRFIPAQSVEELLDAAVTIQRMPGLSGPRCAVLGGGGGVSVLAADICDRAGISVPWFAQHTQDKLREFTPVAGTSIRNPLDAGFMFEGKHRETALTAVADDPGIDWLMLHLGAEGGPTRARDNSFAEETASALADVAAKLPKPMAVVIRQARTEAGFERGLELETRLNEREIACYHSIESCARAVSRYLDWQAAASA